VTRDPEWMAWVEKSARAIMATGAPAIVVTPGTWDNVSVCCGVAGQAEFLLGLFAATDRTEYLDAARKAGAYLVSKATRDDRGARWIQAEHRTRPDLLVAQTGYMQGASGIGMCLLNLSEDRRPHDAVRLPDNPFD
jgi:lantibiotic modifying enzyme